MILLAEMVFAIIVLAMILNTVERVNAIIQNRKLRQFMMNKFTVEQLREINERMENKHE
ncbi:hypothetical protein ACQW5G_00620 [Fructilactobacillus sp. Tb1]|uniref:hypothetical protein n=1 Tax=Fructilactobacillus sp. Tb1 TaxID=3422304 RepID=UPI003D2A8AE3